MTSDLDDLASVPPQDLEAERSVLGAIFLDNAAVWLVAQTLKPEHFYGASHAEVYRTALALVAEGRPVDAVMLRDRLGDRFEKIGGQEALARMVDAVPSAAGVEHYAKIVQAKHALRVLVSAGRRIVHDALTSQDPPDQIVDRAEKALSDTIAGRLDDSSRTIEALVYEEIEYQETPGSAWGLMVGLDRLDALLGGFRPQEMTILAGRPSMGKTSCSLGLARHIACELREPVKFFSQEMSRKQITQNFLAQYTGINSEKMARKTLSADEIATLKGAWSRIKGAPLSVDDAGGLTVMAARAKSRLAAMRGGLSLVIVDYIGLMRGERQKGDNREQEISGISRGLKQLAKELNIPVIVLAQVNRACEARQDKRPMLSDLRESGSLEQDADKVIFVYRHEYYERNDASARGKIELIVAKNRTGATGTAHLRWEKDATRVVDAAPHWSEGNA